MTIGEGEFCSNPGWEDEAGPRVDSDGNAIVQSWGWAPAHTDDQGNSFTDVLMFLFSDGGTGTVWAPFGGDGSATAESNTDGYSWTFLSGVYSTADMIYAAY
jgi:hypothetical protein